MWCYFLFWCLRQAGFGSSKQTPPTLSAFAAKVCFSLWRLHITTEQLLSALCCYSVSFSTNSTQIPLSVWIREHTSSHLPSLDRRYATSTHISLGGTNDMAVYTYYMPLTLCVESFHQLHVWETLPFKARIKSPYLIYSLPSYHCPINYRLLKK